MAARAAGAAMKALQFMQRSGCETGRENGETTLVSTHRNNSGGI